MLAEPLLLIIETDPAVRLTLSRDPNVTERSLGAAIGRRITHAELIA